MEKKKPSPLRDRRSLLQEYNSSAHVNKSISMKEANALLDSYHAKEDKFRGFLESKLELVSSLLSHNIICYYFKLISRTILKG